MFVLVWKLSSFWWDSQPWISCQKQLIFISINPTAHWTENWPSKMDNKIVLQKKKEFCMNQWINCSQILTAASSYTMNSPNFLDLKGSEGQTRLRALYSRARAVHRRARPAGCPAQCQAWASQAFYPWAFRPDFSMWNIIFAKLSSRILHIICDVYGLMRKDQFRAWTRWAWACRAFPCWAFRPNFGNQNRNFALLSSQILNICH